MRSAQGVGDFLDALFGPTAGERLLAELRESGEQPEVLAALESRRSRAGARAAARAGSRAPTARQRDRVRELMVALFDELGQEHELSTRYRKQLATALYYAARAGTAGRARRRCRSGSGSTRRSRAARTGRAGLSAVHDLRELCHADRSGSEVGGIAMSCEDRDVCVRPDVVREQAVALVDDVVVVRHRLARLDLAVLGGSSVRRLTAREPGGVETQLVAVTLAYERPDVAEDPVAARLRRPPSSAPSPS